MTDRLLQDRPGSGRPIPVFDGHNDVLLRLLRRALQPGDLPGEAAFLNGGEGGQLDLPRAIQGGFAGGLFAIFVPADEDPRVEELMQDASYDVPMPAPPEASFAARVTLHMAALLLRTARASHGRLRVCRTAGEIGDTFAAGALGAVLHVEGAEAIDPDFHMLDVLHAAGLRSLGPVWSRPNIFGHGVPFRYPSGPDTGPGLTDLGRELVRRCNALKVMLDLSHLNEAGFWDAARLTDAPLVATHSNAHALCPHSRNLTDRQLDAIAESGGMVGINFAVSFLRQDGRRNADTPLSDVVRHADHLIARLGEDGVGFGSDFDGATVPAAMGDVAGLPRLMDAFRAHGYGEALLAKLCHGNWISLLARTWGEERPDQRLPRVPG